MFTVVLKTPNQNWFLASRSLPSSTLLQEKMKPCTVEVIEMTLAQL